VLASRFLFDTLSTQRQGDLIQAMASAEQQGFDEVAGAVVRLYGERRYAEALTLARDASGRFPKRRATISFWIACLLSLIGEHDDAVAVLADGIERGEWWSEGRLRGDADLASLQGRANFDAVMDAARRRQAANPSRPALEVLRPSTRPRGFVIALHGAGGTIESAAAQWQHATELGYAVGVPLSSQRSGSDDDRRGWDDVTLAAHEVADARDRLARQLELESESAIFAGFSQGGRRVVEWALMGAQPDVRRFIGVASGVDHIRLEDFDRQLASAVRRGIRTAFVVGEEDWVLESVKSFHEALRAAGIASRLDVAPGVGHDYPPDFPSRLPALLAWVDVPS
jgi:predicted esterase